MTRRRYTREFKLEAVRLVSEQEVSVTQTAQDLDLHPSVLRKWVTDYRDDPAHVFPEEWPLEIEQEEIETFNRKLTKLKRGELSEKIPPLTSLADQDKIERNLVSV